MTVIKISSEFMIITTLLSSLFLSNYVTLAEIPEKLPIEKAKLFQVLAREKVAKGFDITRALYLNKKSQEAASKGDIILVNKLLDDALKALNDLPEKPPKMSLVKRVVELPVKAGKAIITEAVPKYKSGQEVKEYETTFDTKTVTARNGIVKLEISSIPIYVEEGGSSTPVLKGRTEDSPFGFHPGYTYNTPVNRNKLVPPSEIGFNYKNSLDIGLRWNRPEFYFLWSIIQRTDSDVKEGVFDWKENDYVYGNVPENIGIVANISGIESRVIRGDMPFPRTFAFKSKFLEEKYIHFVRKIVERYDGDGIDDMPGLKNPIRYWQVDNEPDVDTKDWKGYAHLMEISYKAIKESCPECKVIMGGMAFPKGFEEFYLPVFKHLKGKYIDVFDFHQFGPEWAWVEYKDFVDAIKKGLTENGYDKVEIWITETGTYTERPVVPNLAPILHIPEQAEKEQASSLIKRYIYALSLGVKKIFWAFGIIEGFTGTGNHEFDHTGLIYRRDINGTRRGAEIKKLAYYSYKMMTEKLEGSNFAKIESLNLGEGIYAYKFDKTGRPVYVLWAQ